MKKIMNTPETFVYDMCHGLAKAHPDLEFVEKFKTIKFYTYTKQLSNDEIDKWRFEFYIIAIGINNNIINEKRSTNIIERVIKTRKGKYTFSYSSK